MLERKPFVFLSTIVLVLVVVLTLGVSRLVGAQGEPPPLRQSAATSLGPNLLANPSFDDNPYYFRMPNSLIPVKWYRWDVSRPDGPNPIPEFIDGGSVHHNACYPAPPPGGLCADMIPKNHSLGYIKYGGPYIAGAWQPVQVTPCLDYQFAGYVRTDDPGYRPKLGLDPTGWKTAERPGDFACPPPDENTGEPGVQCYREHFSYESDMPTSTVWSPPFPYDPPTPPIVWRGPISVTTEALSTTITVWTYSAPSEIGSQSTYWDYLSLYQVPRQTPLAPNGLVLAPDLSLNPTVVTGTTTQIQWTTSQPAFSQVFYRLHSSSTVSVTLSLTPTVYLPFVVRSGYVSVDDFAYHTEPTSDMATTHSASLSGLEADKAYDYMVVVRQFGGSTCASTGLIGTFTTP
jgi:hypothetical protein